MPNQQSLEQVELAAEATVVAKDSHAAGRAAAVARCGGRTIVGDRATDAGAAAPSPADREAVAEAASLVASAAAGFTRGSTIANVAAAATGSETRAAVASR